MENQSIHPRNWTNERNGKKKNTCAPRNNSKNGLLARKQANLLRRRNAHSATLKSLSATHATAFKTPGSMKLKA